MSIRVNKAHMVHESSNFGDAIRWSGSGVRRAGEPWKLGSVEAWSPRERVFSTKHTRQLRQAGLLVPWCARMMQVGKLDRRDQNHCAVQQSRVVRITAAQLRQQKVGSKRLHRCETCAVSMSEPSVVVCGPGDGGAPHQTKEDRQPYGQ
jgi:hypothetical protein